MFSSHMMIKNGKKYKKRKTSIEYLAPIQETPILTGKDAERFLKRMEEKHRVSKEEYDAVMEVYDKYEKITDWN